MTASQEVEASASANEAPNGRYRLRALRYDAELMGLGNYNHQDVLRLQTPGQSVTIKVKQTLRFDAC